MRATERRAAIERELRLTGKVSVAELAKAMSTSPISIRRDLNTLVERGVARRVHGGAIAVGERTTAPGRPRPVRRPGAVDTRPITIGLVIPSARYYFTGVLDGVKAAAAQTRVRVVLAVSGYSGEEERSQIRRLVDRGVQALVVTPAQIVANDAETYRALVDLPLPVVLMERDGGDEYAALDSVRSDHAYGARMAFGRLAGVGHRAVMLVCAERTATAGWLRAGFEATRDQFDVAERVAIPSAPEFDPELRQRVDEALDRCVELGVTGALVHPDVAAILMAQRARERGIDTPGGLEIIAYDDEVAALADPALDAVAPPKDEVGRLALRLAFERARTSRNGALPRHIALPPTLVLRGLTLRPAPSAGPEPEVSV
ncbi:substrate-binding domain-containing protein [Xylanimonas ulmi]|uniref:DNA-binding LacI/PurR family transcriptional regulator n=1 Tax=Xylanimonas ulmi TaxID=228973 RepID=A0A4Q7M4I5_9MICO|nr:substrate-binding domain-containing protein [Xylanibacterium ulmi]RZS61923.1 DNA-binding LacI/PurR family transcriptional regulator [Xylanibacterium ulmi]